MLVLFSLALVINVSDVSAATVNNSSAPQQTVSSQGATPVSPQVTYAPSDVNAAATKIKTFYDTNHRLPNYVTMNNRQVTMPQFLELLTTDVTQANTGSTASIVLKNVNNPSNPTETVQSGTLTKTEFVGLAQTVKTSIDTTGAAPNNVNSSLGQIRFESLIYLFSKTMSFYATNNRLPNTLSVTPWSGNTTTEGSGQPLSNTAIDQAVAQIMKTASKFSYSSASHDAAGLVKYGSGDCWAMSDYLYKQFTAAGVRARVLQYPTAYASNHRSVQYMENGKWVDAPYRTYFSTDMFNNTSGTASGSVIADNKLY